MIQRVSLVIALTVSGIAFGQEPNKHLLLVLDGLRPDYVTPEVMPNLHALGQPRRRVHESSRRLSDRDAGELVVDLDRRVSGASRDSRQLGLLPAGRSRPAFSTRASAPIWSESRPIRTACC